MWWGKSADDKDAKNPPTSTGKETGATATTRTTAAEASPDPRYDSSKTKKNTSAPPAFDPDKLPERQKLSPALQKIVDRQEKEENYFDELYDG